MSSKINRKQKNLIEKLALTQAQEQFFGGITKTEAIEIFKVLSLLAQFPGANSPEPLIGCEVTWTSTLKVGDSLDEQVFNVQVSYKGLAFIYTTKGNRVIQLPDSTFINLESWDSQAFLLADKMGLSRHLLSQKYEREFQADPARQSPTELYVEKQNEYKRSAFPSEGASEGVRNTPPHSKFNSGWNAVRPQLETKKNPAFKISDFRVGQSVILTSNLVAKISYVGYQPNKMRTDRKQYVRLDFEPPHPVFGSEYWLSIREAKKYIKEIKED